MWKEFFNKHLISLIILALLVVVYLQRCSGGSPNVPRNTHDTVTSTIIITHDTVIITKPKIINHIIANTRDIPPPDSSYAGLRRQYDSLSGEYYSKNISEDKINIDSIGWVKTTDTTQRNRITGRKWDYNIKERIITREITNTIYPEPKLQVYAGFGVMGEQTKLVNGGEIGLLLKNRKDQMFGISAQKVAGWPIEYTISSYWKIRLRR